MKFENKGKWFNESEDTDKDMLNDEQQELAMEDDAGDLLAEDELDLADEDIDDDSEDIFNDEEQIQEACKYRNEVRYIDPANLDKYSKDEIEEVTTASGEKRYKRKGSVPFKDDPKKDDSTQKAFEISDLQKQVASLEQTANKYKSMAMAAGKSGRNQQALNMYKLALDKLDGAKAALAKKTAEYKSLEGSGFDKPKALNDFKTIVDLPGNSIFDKSYSMIDQYEKENPDVSDEDKIKFFENTKEALDKQFRSLRAQGNDDTAWDVKKAWEVLDEANDMVKNNVYYKKALSNLGDTKDITNELPKELSKRLKDYYKKYSQTTDKYSKNMYTAASKDIIYRYAGDLDKFDSDTLVNYFKTVAPGLKDASLNKIATFGKSKDSKK